MKEFQDLLALALVGTARGPLPAHDGSPLAPALNSVQDDPEGTLLGRAALAGLVRYAGRTADPPSGDPPPLAPPETRPEAPGRVVRHLNGILETTLLPEWLSLCAGAGWRVPPQVLPTLLDLARHNTEWREQLRPVLGERGVWLSQFSSEWRWGSSFSEEAWEGATEAHKEALFRDLLAQDAQAGHDWLVNRFGKERAGVRQRLLAVLRGTLSEDDVTLEPLLENALQDRSSEVRGEAIVILLGLPHSAYNARMAARLVAMVRHEKVGWLGKLIGKQKTVLQVSEQPDPHAARDGLPAPEGTSESQARNYFGLLLKSTHPQAALLALEYTPAELVALARSLGVLDELESVFFQTRYLPLGEALAADLPGKPYLLGLADPQQVLVVVRQRLRQRTGSAELLPWLKALPGRWPADLSQRVLELLHEQCQVARQSNRDSSAYQMLSLLQEKAAPGLTLPAPFSPDDPAQPEQIDRQLQKRFNTVLSVLKQRNRMYRDFAEAQA